MKIAYVLRPFQEAAVQRILAAPRYILFEPASMGLGVRDIFTEALKAKGVKNLWIISPKFLLWDWKETLQSRQGPTADLITPQMIAKRLAAQRPPEYVIVEVPFASPKFIKSLTTLTQLAEHVWMRSLLSRPLSTKIEAERVPLRINQLEELSL